jgi:hypothetical protein
VLGGVRILRATVCSNDMYHICAIGGVAVLGHACFLGRRRSSFMGWRTIIQAQSEA